MTRSFWLAMGLAASLWAAVAGLAVLLALTVASCETHVLPAPARPVCVATAWPAVWVPWAILALAAMGTIASVAAGVRYFVGLRRRTRSSIRRMLLAETEPSEQLTSAASSCGIERLEVVDVPDLVALTRGYLRPKVIVSTGLVGRVSTGELRAILRHEACHARRRDPFRLSLGRVTAVALFPFPVVRDLVGHAEMSAEIAADRAAAAEEGDASLLSALAVLQGWRQPAQGDAALSSICGKLEGRLEFIASGARPEVALGVNRLRTTIASVAVLAVLCAGLVSAALRVGIL